MVDVLKSNFVEKKQAPSKGCVSNQRQVNVQNWIRRHDSWKLGLAASVEGEKLNEAITQNYIYVDWGTAFANFHAKRFGESVIHLPQRGVHTHINHSNTITSPRREQAL